MQSTRKWQSHVPIQTEIITREIKAVLLIQGNTTSNIGGLTLNSPILKYKACTYFKIQTLLSLTNKYFNHMNLYFKIFSNDQTFVAIN